MNNTSTSKYILGLAHEYSLHVAQQRSIPHIADSLKSSQRLILYALGKKAERIKTAALTGELMASGLYHNGDASCNLTISYLAGPFKNNLAFVAPHGAFGTKIDPDSMGAGRYTSVSRSRLADAFLYVDSDIVPMRDNYDGNKEPEHLLPLLPLTLLNGIAGIAVGFSTEILPRDFLGLVNASIDALNEKKTLRGLDPHYMRYDLEINKTGHNQYEFIGRVKIEGNVIRVTELPPGLSLEKFRKSLIQLEEADDSNIISFTDRSRDEINVEVKFKRGSISSWTEADAIAFFKLKVKVTERIVVVNWDGKSIRTIDDPATLVREFVQWRLGWYTTRFEKLRDDASHELIYWRLLKALFDNGFTKKLGTFPNKSAMAAAVEAVAKKVKIVLGEGHLDRALSLATYRWTKEFEAEVGQKIAGIEADIAEYISTIASPEKLKSIYMGELEALKKLKL